MVKQITINLQDDILDMVNIYAKARGLEIEEALKFIIGDAISGVFRPPVMPPPMADPMKLLMNIFAGTGMCKCQKCSTKLTADEIMVNGDQCFKCKPDTRALEF